MFTHLRDQPSAITRSGRATLGVAGLVCLAFLSAAVTGAPLAAAPIAQATTSIFQATLGEPNQKTAEVSTDELRSILQDHSAIVFDSRPHMEFSVSHIPGALNVAPKPGVPMSQYVSDVSEIGRLVDDQATPIVLYCNGPYCGKSKRLGEDLVAAGYLNVRRYQLGAPTWRALGGIMQIELDGVRYVREGDHTAVFVDGRTAEDFQTMSLTGSRNIPLTEVAAAKDDGRLPMDDHNTRIVVFGADTNQARAVATELANNAFDNVTYFDGTFTALMVALGEPAAGAVEAGWTAAPLAFSGPGSHGRVDILMAEVDSQEFILAEAGPALRYDLAPATP